MDSIHTNMFKRAADFQKPSLWLYGKNDSSYGIAHSRGNFDAFIAEGGKGSFLTFSLGTKKDGHKLLYKPELWRDAVDAFIDNLEIAPN